MGKLDVRTLAINKAAVLMSTKISVASRVHRILRRMPRFQSDHLYYALLSDKGLTLLQDEQFLGVYFNKIDQVDEAVAVTDLGIYIRSTGEWISVRFDEIENATISMPAKKEEAEIINLTIRKSRQVIAVPVRGEGPLPRTKDVYEFLRFLMRVSKDQY